MGHVRALSVIHCRVLQSARLTHVIQSFSRRSSCGTNVFAASREVSSLRHCGSLYCPSPGLSGCSLESCSELGALWTHTVLSTPVDVNRSQPSSWDKHASTVKVTHRVAAVPTSLRWFGRLEECRTSRHATGLLRSAYRWVGA